MSTEQVIATEEQVARATRLVRVGGPLGDVKLLDTFQEVLALVVNCDDAQASAKRLERGATKLCSDLDEADRQYALKCAEVERWRAVASKWLEAVVLLPPGTTRVAYNTSAAVLAKLDEAALAHTAAAVLEREQLEKS